MSEHDILPEELMRELGSAGVPEQEEGAATDQRRRVLANMRQVHAQAIARRSRARRLRTVFAWVAAAALPALTVSAAWYLSAARSQVVALAPPPAPPVSAYVSSAAVGVTVVHPASAVTADGTSVLRSGDEVSTGTSGPAEVRMPSGAKVTVATGSNVRLEWQVEPDGMQEHVLLRTGGVDVSVPKLPAGGAFMVSTPDSDVSVHGTKFRVVVQGGDGADDRLHTLVSVTEGRVLTRHSGRMTTLGPGETWDSSDAGPAAAASQSDPAAGVAPAESARPGRPVTPAKPPTTPENTLAQENALFDSALEAARMGDDARAVGFLNRLLRDHPSSPLAGAARRELARAQQRLRRSDTEGAGP